LSTKAIYYLPVNSYVLLILFTVNLAISAVTAEIAKTVATSIDCRYVKPINLEG